MKKKRKKRGRMGGEKKVKRRREKNKSYVWELSGMSLKEHMCIRSGLYFYRLINP